MGLQQGHGLVHVAAADGEADVLALVPADGLEDDVHVDVLLAQQREDFIGDTGAVLHAHQGQTGYVLVFCHAADLGLFHLLCNLLDFRARFSLETGQHF